MEELFLPVLSHFQNKNTWIASDGKLRYQVTPATITSEDGQEGHALFAEVWEGPWSREFSVIESVGEFPMCDEGIEALRAWLTEQSGQINARPDRSMAENLERREAAIQAREAAGQAQEEQN